MMRTVEDFFSKARMEEMAMRAYRSGRAHFTPFLSPPQAQEACVAASRMHGGAWLYGGYPDAERQMVCFFSEEPPSEAYPIAVLRLSWANQATVAHRDLLGSILSLGIQRRCIGDIVLSERGAYLFAEQAMAQHIEQNLVSAGRTSLQVTILQHVPVLPKPEGMLRKGTVSSLRLDALVATGLCLSRGKAAELVEAGNVKLRFLQEVRIDARVMEGDMISVRGAGRLRLDKVGQMTRKGRIPVCISCFGLTK